MIWRLVAVVIAAFRLVLPSCKQRELEFLLVPATGTYDLHF